MNVKRKMEFQILVELMTMIDQYQVPTRDLMQRATTHPKLNVILL